MRIEFEPPRPFNQHLRQFFQIVVRMDLVIYVQYLRLPLHPSRQSKQRETEEEHHP
jgi:hypothetical protein